MNKEKTCHRCPDVECATIPGNKRIKTILSTKSESIEDDCVTGCMEPVMKIDSCGYCGHELKKCYNLTPRTAGRAVVTFLNSRFEETTEHKLKVGENIQECVIFRKTILGEK